MRYHAHYHTASEGHVSKADSKSFLPVQTKKGVRTLCRAVLLKLSLDSWYVPRSLKSKQKGHSSALYWKNTNLFQMETLEWYKIEKTENNRQNPNRQAIRRHPVESIQQRVQQKKGGFFSAREVGIVASWTALKSGPQDGFSPV